MLPLIPHAMYIGNQALDNMVLPLEQGVHNALEATLLVARCYHPSRSLTVPRELRSQISGVTTTTKLSRPEEAPRYLRRTSLVLTVLEIAGSLQHPKAELSTSLSLSQLDNDHRVVQNLLVKPGGPIFGTHQSPA